MPQRGRSAALAMVLAGAVPPASAMESGEDPYVRGARPGAPTRRVGAAMAQRGRSAKAERDAGVSAVLFAQSLLEAHAPPGAARPGRWEGTTPEGAWRVEIGGGEDGPRGVALRPVRVAVGGVLLETLRPGPAEPQP